MRATAMVAWLGAAGIATWVYWIVALWIRWGLGDNPHHWYHFVLA